MQVIIFFDKKINHYVNLHNNVISLFLDFKILIINSSRWSPFNSSNPV